MKFDIYPAVRDEVLQCLCRKYNIASKIFLSKSQLIEITFDKYIYKISESRIGIYFL